MKTFRLAAAALVLILMVSDSCKKFDLNTDELDLSIDLDIIKTHYEIRFTDAATGNFIGEEDEVLITGRVFGPDSLSVLDVSGYRRGEYTSTMGRMLLELDPYTAKPDTADPVTFNLLVEAKGYLAATYAVATDTLGDFYFEVPMAKLASPPSGSAVKIVENAGTARNGLLAENMQVETDGGEASVSLIAGTRLKDAAGQPLNGSLKVQLASFSPTDNHSRQAFPGGSFGATVDSAGTHIEAYMESAGFFNLEIRDQAGKSAHLIGNDSIRIGFKLDPTIINPLTGLPIQEGDQLPLWSFDQAKGIWVYEHTEPIGIGPAGLQVEADLPHLTWYDFGWTRYPVCTSFYYTFVTDRTEYRNTPFKYLVRAFIRSAGGWSYYGAATTPEMLQNQQCFPANANAENHLYKIPLTPSAFRFDSRARIKIMIVCADRQEKIIPKESIYCRYRFKESTCWSYQYIKSGESLVYGIKPGAIFEVQAFYQNKWQPEIPYEYTIDQNYQHGTETTLTFKVDMKCN